MQYLNEKFLAPNQFTTGNSILTSISSNTQTRSTEQCSLRYPLQPPHQWKRKQVWAQKPFTYIDVHLTFTILTPKKSTEIIFGGGGGGGGAAGGGGGGGGGGGWWGG
jgi:uncharacterized membrane protein YgcG